MPRTGFNPQVHGFAFANTWKFDDAERQHLSNHFAAYLTQRHILGPVGAHLNPLRIRAIRSKLESHLAPEYGLCGGMCFTALDFYKAGLPIPKGQNANDRPAPGTHLHSTIWKRQLDSLVSDGARFLAWLIILNHVRPVWVFGGGPAWLLARSKEEWKKLKASVDSGEPVPIGLVRDTNNVYDNHQVLAIGYEEADGAHGTIILYDPNCPNKESTISFEFGVQQLDGQESCDTSAPLRGFFCETYARSDPTDDTKQMT